MPIDKGGKFRLWDEGALWQTAESRWDRGAERARQLQPLRGLKSLPAMPGLTKETARHLRLKSLLYMVGHDRHFSVLRKALRHPFRHFKNYLKSLRRKKAHVREGDFYLYGYLRSEEFSRELADDSALLIAGFSYCHKPHECPSGRFTTECIADPENAICRQCFIGKMVNALPENRAIPLFITTVHYIGEQVLEILNRHPGKRVVFLITACEMTLEMFGDWGNMAGIRGIGVRLDGRICNTMRAFALSERGIKPGLTLVMPETQRRMLDLIRRWREALSPPACRD